MRGNAAPRANIRTVVRGAHRLGQPAPAHLYLRAAPRGVPQLSMYPED